MHLLHPSYPSGLTFQLFLPSVVLEIAVCCLGHVKTITLIDWLIDWSALCHICHYCCCFFNTYFISMTDNGTLCNNYVCLFLADCTVCIMIRYWHNVVHLSVCLSVTLFIVAKRYILQQVCQNKWIGSAALGTRLCNFHLLDWPHVIIFPTSWTVDVGVICCVNSTHTAKNWKP